MQAVRVFGLGFWLFFSVLTSAQATIRVISDVDDTVKITGVESWTDAIPNAVCSRDAFPGMAPLYRELLTSDPRAGRPEGDSLLFVTGSPSLLRGAIEEFLSLHPFPQAKLVTRNAFGRPDTWTYKTKTIDQWIREQRKEEGSEKSFFLLFGDDGERDPQVYQEIQKRFSGEVAAVFIRQIRGEVASLAGQIPIYSAVDAGLVLWGMGILKAESLFTVILDFFDQKSGVLKADLAFPVFAECPGEWEWLSRVWGDSLQSEGQEELLQLLQDFEHDVFAACLNRSARTSRVATVGRDLD